MKKYGCFLFLTLAFASNLLFAVGVGGSVPNITLPLVSNSSAKVNVGGINSKYVLIDFWASWCAPCRVSMSTLSKLSNSLGSKGFKVVGISLDKDPELAKQFLKKYPASFTQLLDTQGISAKQFGLPKVPTSYLIGPDKKIIGIFPGYNEANLKAIKQLVK
ncbi:TlpA family protein disulfide reductase [Legionella bononiensis]|uniref:TlpA family protein disulfide reductase n=1 Tax=Legionella bononiensis TaxID=2793102 RepID=UPI0019341B42|nr:TlpA disulfide reductase family protein [Legionella bononiensis]MBL7480586.1 TlpA family protein disulfide reductase [Legionella bononiensis]